MTGLAADGIIERQDFIGLDDLQTFRFFANSFDTTTTGIDIVGDIGFALGSGDSTVTIAANYNKTEVDNVGSVNPIGQGRVAALEDLLPNYRANISWNHQVGSIRTLLRLNYYGEWDDTGNGVPGMSSKTLVDVQGAWQFNDSTEFVFGVENLFDTYPDENPFAGDLGQIYAESNPFGFNGGAWYLQARVTF